MSRPLEPLCRGSGRPHYPAKLNTVRGFYPGELRPVILPTNKPAQEPGQVFVGAFKRVIVALKSHSCHIQDTGDASLSGPGSLTKWVSSLSRSTC